MRSYIPRFADEVIADRLKVLPALLVIGPRAAGKTTTARRHAAHTVRLDRPADAVAFAADPDAALRGLPEPVLLDEWQAVPDVLGAVKRAVDDDPRPGRFLLTGSVRADLDVSTWPGTGRVVRVTMHGLTERELSGRTGSASFLHALSHGSLDDLAAVGDLPDLPGYIDVALRGGFPEAALLTSQTHRMAWLTSYLEQLLTRDALHLSDRDPVRMARYFEAVALNTAGVVADKSLHDAAGIDRKTALAYDRLLTNLLVIDAVPAWTANRLSRLVKTSKRYLVDPSLAGAALRLDRQAVMRHGDLIGRVLDTLVMAQLRAETAVDPMGPRLHHLRDKNGRHEIDLLAEMGAGAVVGIEVKATASPRPHDARHLQWLQAQLGPTFLAGAVLHTGPRSFRLAPGLFALPIAALWSGRHATAPTVTP